MRRVRGAGRRDWGAAGFSLVEVTVAIGIFAFVVVGVLGLLPAGMKMQAESAQETRALLIAQEMFSAVRAAPSITNVILRDGPAQAQRNNQVVDLSSGPVVVGFPSQTTVPFGLWHPQRGNDPDKVWEQGQLEAWAVGNGISTLARLSATNVPGATNLFEVKVEVRQPASVSLSNSVPSVFSSFITSSGGAAL